MNTNISNIINVIEEIKHNISDNQYKIIMDSLMKISNNMKINLLDLNNDILSIIGNYVLRDNRERIEKKNMFDSINKEFYKHKISYRPYNKYNLEYNPYLRKITYVLFEEYGIDKTHPYVEEFLKRKKIYLKKKKE
jgi:hypothetical protein